MTKRRPKGPSDLAQVRAVLEHYATRGTFSSFGQVRAHGGQAAFRFNWFRGVPFTVTFDTATRKLTFRELLPAVPARSEMDRDLRTFVKERESRALPEHRRVDRRKVELTIVNRASAISLVCALKGPHTEYGVRKAVHVVHEIFTDFLNDGRFEVSDQ